MKTGRLTFKDQLFVWQWELKTMLKPKKFNAKVFCIGYNKTGTTALGQALKQLGYDHSTFNRKVWRKHYKQGNVKAILNYTARFESFDDLPWLKEDMIPVLDKAFEGSKFIYLKRDEEKWKNSIKNWTEKVSSRKIDEEKALENYLTHQKFVRDYFENRPADLIELEINDPRGFEKLADFLDKKAPQPNFMVFNQT